MLPASRESIFWNALNIFLDNSYAKMRNAFSQHGSWEKAWMESTGRNAAQAESFLKEGSDDIRIITDKDPDFPGDLKEISHSPFGLYIKGSLSKNIPIGIVGTRKATSDGQEEALLFSRKLAERGISIVSGLAFGIDKAAHEGCLKASGHTVAVLANGLSSVYPSSNSSLAKKILENGGALISEYHPKRKPEPFRFLERNRIVSGLSRGVLVIEAPKASGSLATARFALDQNRDVFVVPGPVRHPNYAGSHELIRAGAELVTRPEDILEEYGIEPASKNAELATFEEKAIVEVLREAKQGLDAEEICEATGFEISVVNKTLSYLVVESVIKENGSSYFI